MFTIWVKELVPGAEQPQRHSLTHRCYPLADMYMSLLVKTQWVFVCVACTVWTDVLLHPSVLSPSLCLTFTCIILLVLGWLVPLLSPPILPAFILARLLPSLKTFNRTQLEDFVSSNLITLSLWWKIECIDHWLSSVCRHYAVRQCSRQFCPLRLKRSFVQFQNGTRPLCQEFCMFFPFLCQSLFNLFNYFPLMLENPFFWLLLISHNLIYLYECTQLCLPLADVHKSVCHVTLKGC